jgi:alpha-L-arabinofuranosidase
LLLTVVNPDTKQARETTVSLAGASAAAATARVLAASDIHARNTFANRDAVVPRSAEVTLRSGAITHVFPPASVTAMVIHLA